MEATGTTVTIHRVRASIGALRRYRILLDGKEALTLKNGETRSLLVPAGKHVLTVRIDWIKSKAYELSVPSSEPIRLACITTASDLSEYFKAILGIASDYLRISPIESTMVDQTGGPAPSFPWVSVLKRSALWIVLVLGTGLGLAIYLEAHATFPGRGEQLSNLIGRLTGYLTVGGIAWIALQSAAARTGETRVLRTNRRILVGLVGLWLCAGVAGFVFARRQPSEHVQFIRGCSRSCLEAGAASDLCTRYCACMASTVLDGELRTTFTAYTDAISKGHPPDPDVQREIERAQEQCRSKGRT